jgi:hypothetical protein
MTMLSGDKSNWGFEPIRPLRCVDAPMVAYDEGLFRVHRVFYGENWWPSKAFWLVPQAMPDI